MSQHFIKKARTLIPASVPVQQRIYFFALPLAILSVKPFPALNLGTFLALIFKTAPVCGLRPTRAARLETEKVPKPTSVTLSPFFKEDTTARTMCRFPYTVPTYYNK